MAGPRTVPASTSAPSEVPLMLFLPRAMRVAFAAGCPVLLLSLAAAQTVITPPESKFFSTVGEERYSTYQMTGNGDLWPSCWADDDSVYAANGDGTAFSGGTAVFDMAVSRITGVPPSLK